jgi:hypothetical protein
MRFIGSHSRSPGIGLRERLIDAFVESYLEWREGCEDLERAYQRWTGSAPLDRDLAFLAYHAALDREEKAAHVYELRADELARQADARAAQAHQTAQ